MLEYVTNYLGSAYDELIEAKGDRISISIARGVSVYNPDADTKYEDIFTRADHNMYIHKDETKSKK